MGNAIKDLILKIQRQRKEIDRLNQKLKQKSKFKFAPIKDDFNCVYIAGPMTGLPNYNFDAFNAAEARLKEKGLQVFNPAKMGAEFIAQYGDGPKGSDNYFKLIELSADVLRCYCDAIYLLNGWQNSEGARGELILALNKGYKVFMEGVDYV